jgi:spore germination protein
LKIRVLTIIMACVLSLFTVTVYAQPSGTSNAVSIISVKADKAYVYQKPASSSLKMTSLRKAEEFPIVATLRYYYKIQLLGQKTGYIKKSQVQVKRVKRVVIGWNYFGNTDTYMKQNSVSPNLNIVSPPWYSLADGDHPITVKSDGRYVVSSHNIGKKVWPLLGNKFDAALTDAFLSNPAKRQKAVSIIKDNLVQTGADGINVDFENIEMKNKRDFVAFVTELRKALKPLGKVVSVDVTRTNPDPNWSGSYDRRGLGKAADFVVLMGYEEHWAAGGKAGSTGSIPWVREGIQLLMNDVPAHKIILALPFYTREWITDAATNQVTAMDRSMYEVEKIIADKGLTKTWDTATAQNYVEFTENNQKHQIWIEDKASMAIRRDLVNKYKLGGVAAWRIGLETPDVWTVFDQYR